MSKKKEYVQLAYVLRPKSTLKWLKGFLSSYSEMNKEVKKLFLDYFKDIEERYSGDLLSLIKKELPDSTFRIYHKEMEEKFSADSSYSLYEHKLKKRFREGDRDYSKLSSNDIARLIIKEYGLSRNEVSPRMINLIDSHKSSINMILRDIDTIKTKNTYFKDLLKAMRKL